MGRKQSKKDLNDKARQSRENHRAALKSGHLNPDDSNQFIVVAKKKKKEVCFFKHAPAPALERKKSGKT